MSDQRFGVGRLGTAVATILVAVAWGTVAPASASPAAGMEPQVTFRQFCLPDEGGIQLAVNGSGFEPSTEGTVLLVQGDGSSGPYPSTSDKHGVVETSWGIGLWALDDPRLGPTAVVTVSVAGTSITESVNLACDPNANAPSDKGECHVELFRNFFSFVGLTFRNTGECIAFVANQGKE